MYDNGIDCIVLAGDGVHDQTDFHDRWPLFGRNILRHPMLNDGFMIPVLTALGNHDGRATPPHQPYFGILTVQLKTA